MASDVDARPRHRGPARRSSRPIWTVAAGLVLAGAVVAVVLSAAKDHRAQAQNPLITLGRTSDVDPQDVVSGTLTLTGSCLSLPSGLAVWPIGSTWDPVAQSVLVSHPAMQWAVGEAYGLPGTILDHIPTTATAVIPQTVIDALEECSRTTGIRTVAFVG